MFKRFIPFAYGKNIFEVDVKFFKRHNITTLLVDLDNTLDSYKAHSPSSRVLALKDKLDLAKIELIIISNNKEKRVKPYADALGVKYLSSAHKPFKKRVLNYLMSQKIDKENVILVGDQLLTDVSLARNAGLRCLLVDPIVKEDQWTTHFNRLLDRPIRAYLKKAKLLKSWE